MRAGRATLGVPFMPVHLPRAMNWTGTSSSPNEPLANLPGHFPDLPPERVPGHMTSIRSHIEKYLMLLFRAAGLSVVRVLSSLVFLLAYVVGGALKAIYFLERPRWSPLLTSSTTVSNVIKNDPIQRVEHFVATLEDHLSPQHHFPIYNGLSGGPGLPPFFQGSYTRALYLATHRAKFLFIYITNPRCDGSQAMLDKIVSNPAFVAMFSNENIIIWGGDAASPEAYELANNINITKFPMLGLLCLTRTTKMTPDGPTKSTPRISLVLKLQGVLDDSVDPDSLVEEKFTSKVAKYEPELALVRAELNEKWRNERIRQDQDRKYQESLRKDHLKKQEQQRQKLFVKYLKWKQPHIKSLLERSASEGCLRIAIKFADGESCTLCFPADSTIEELYLFVEMKKRDMLDKDYDVALNNTEAHDFQKPISAYDFNLITPIPPRVGLNGLDLTTKISQLDFLHPTGRLMVDKV